MMKDFYKQDRTGALADLDSAIKLGPTDYEVYRHRADLKIFAGDYDGAIADLNIALPHVGPMSFALQDRGRAKLGKKDYDGAIADFTEEIGKKHPWIHLTLGAALRRLCRQGKHRRGAHRLQPGDPAQQHDAVGLCRARPRLSGDGRRREGIGGFQSRARKATQHAHLL